MRKLFIAATVYMGAGLASGLFYREFTKLNDFPEGGVTQLGGVHTHFLALGTLTLLIVLALEKTLSLSAGQPRVFTWFFWTYNAGLVVTAGMQLLHGSLTVLGQESTRMIADIAGTGHALMGAGFVLLFVMIGRAVRRDARPAEPALASAAA